MAFLFASFFTHDTAQPVQQRSLDAATGGRRSSALLSYGRNATETLAAAAPLRSRVPHAYANNGYIQNGVNAIVAEAVGAGIEPASAHPDIGLHEPLDQEWLTFAGSRRRGRPDRSAWASGPDGAGLRSGRRGFVAQIG